MDSSFYLQRKTLIINFSTDNEYCSSSVFNKPNYSFNYSEESWNEAKSLYLRFNEAKELTNKIHNIIERKNWKTTVTRIFSCIDHAPGIIIGVARQGQEGLPYFEKITHSSNQTTYKISSLFLINKRYAFREFCAIYVYFCNSSSVWKNKFRIRHKRKQKRYKWCWKYIPTSMFVLLSKQR